MTITHHPLDETLLAYASGRLDSGRSVVVAAHLARCHSCSRVVGSLTSFAGTMLAEMAPSLLSNSVGAVSIVEKLATEVRQSSEKLSPVKLKRDGGLQLPLNGDRAGQWKWMGPGVRWMPVDTPVDGSARVFLLKASPGTRMPHHTHTGSELTLVLAGAFVHSGGRYASGDLDEADEEIEHQPIVETGADCICLVAMEGQLKLLGWMGRALQPFVRL